MKRFLWHTLGGGLLIFDYFLFVTGNPSITYSLLGGWFEIPLILRSGCDLILRIWDSERNSE